MRFKNLIAVYLAGLLVASSVQAAAPLPLLLQVTLSDQALMAGWSRETPLNFEELVVGGGGGS